MMDQKIEEIIQRDGFVLEMTVGDSMEPMLKNRQNPIVIERVTERPKKHDVVLYKRDSGQYVLHRIVKVRPNDYAIRGDNRLNTEYGVCDRHIIGVLKGYYIGERYVDCATDKEYKRYVSSLKYKYLARKAKELFGRAMRKLGRVFTHNK